MKQYLSLVSEILENGERKEDRTGTGTLSIFGVQRKYDLRDGFPLLTTKKVLFDGVLHELLWFLKGSTNINEGLTEHTPIWDAWADANGELGPIYGKQWRRWNAVNGREIDQIREAVEMIKTNPDSRRIIVNAWNVGDIDQMALPPCHAFFQFYVVNGRLDCQLYQRSADVALGVPFNIASYATLMHIIAQECELEAGVFTHTMGDAHIYLNHIDGLLEQLKREPKSLPILEIQKKPMDKLKFEDFKIINYKPEAFIKFKVAV